MSKIEPIEAVEQPQNIQSLEDIAAYKDKLRKQIEHEEECIADKWNELFHKEEPAPQGKALTYGEPWFGYVRRHDARLEALSQISRGCFLVRRQKKEA